MKKKLLWRDVGMGGEIQMKLLYLLNVYISTYMNICCYFEMSMYSCIEQLTF